MLVRRALGEACAQARLRAGLTQEQVAARAGVGRATVSRLETGAHMVEDVEALVEVYELVCGLRDGTLWRRAVRDASRRD